MAYNKVVYGGNTLIDLTDLDVTAGDVLSGVTVILADGTKAVGTLSVLQNLVDGSEVGSIRSVGAKAEDSGYTMGLHAVAEGHLTKASGRYSHAEGYSTDASGSASHAQNQGTVAKGWGQTVIGTYNIENGSTTTRVGSDYALIIGNGTSTVPSNALTVNWNGDTEQAGRATTKDMTSQEVEDFVDDLSFDGSSVKEIRSGITSSISVSASSYTDVSVVFDAEMSGTPVVVCSVYSTSTAPTIGLITASAINITSMGFTVRVFNADTAGRTPAVSYIAVYGG